MQNSRNNSPSYCKCAECIFQLTKINVLLSVGLIILILVLLLYCSVQKNLSLFELSRILLQADTVKRHNFGHFE